MTLCPDCARAPIARHGLIWRCECSAMWWDQCAGDWSKAKSQAQNAHADQIEHTLKIRRAERALIDALMRAHWNRGDAAALDQALDAAALLADLTGSRYAPK